MLQGTAMTLYHSSAFPSLAIIFMDIDQIAWNVSFMGMDEIYFAPIKILKKVVAFLKRYSWYLGDLPMQLLSRVFICSVKALCKTSKSGWHENCKKNLHVAVFSLCLALLLCGGGCEFWRCYWRGLCVFLQCFLKVVVTAARVPWWMRTISIGLRC